MKFKVGDRVKIISNPGCLNIGDIGIITKIHPREEFYPYTVTRKDDFHDAFLDKELDYIKIKDTKIGRKLNQGKIDRIESGWIYLNG